jgi:glyoxylase-like metal-dependent hydrolase (beta-lactamase superfamily II)
MSRWLRRTLVVLGAVLAIGVAAYWYFIGDGAPPATLPAFSIDLASVRAKAEELPGGKATRIRVETVAAFNSPAVAALGGDGWNTTPMGAFSYQVILPADTIVIDSALNAAMGASFGAVIDDDAYARMDAAMADATQIVVTHEHPDHIGGIIAYPGLNAILKQLRLNKEQVESLGLYGLTLPEGLKDLVPIDYAEPLAIAPGVVLIRAPGHSPGSQLIYVRMADGKEVLFIGDIAWTSRNVDTAKGKPRLVSAFMLKEDREMVFAQLRALQALHEAEPGLLIVPGHDVSAIDALIAADAMARGFSP